MAVIIDTSAIIALADKADKNHKKAVNFTSKNKDVFIVPITVLPEACYLLNEHISDSAEIIFLTSLSNGEVQVEDFKSADFDRVLEILQKYRDLRIGFVDASIVALAERLNVNKLFTFDRKHFSAIRFKRAHFDLLPY